MADIMFTIDIAQRRAEIEVRLATEAIDVTRRSWPVDFHLAA